MGNFDVNTGAVSSPAGTATAGPGMTAGYIDIVYGGVGRSGNSPDYPKSVNLYNLEKLGPGNELAVVNTDANNLPNLTLYLIKNPSITTLV